jgi:hypothetical protein
MHARTETAMPTKPPEAAISATWLKTLGAQALNQYR